MVYLYDGRLDGFLTCIYEHYYSQEATAIYESEVYQPTLFDEVRMVETDTEKANRVHKAIIEKLSEPVYWDIYYTFLSKDPNKDCYLLRYIVEGFRMGHSIYGLYTTGAAHYVKRMSRKVSGERHLYLGLLRFKDMGSCLYAPFEPEHDILESLAGHFADRYLNERFIIHDINRKKAVISNLGRWVVMDFDVSEEIVDSEKEVFFQQLWKTYFETVGIEKRRNPKLQKGFVPLKRRKHLTEFTNE